MPLDPDLVVVVLQAIASSSTPVGWYQLARSKSWFQLGKILQSRGEELPTPVKILSLLEESGLVASAGTDQGYSITKAGGRYLQEESDRVAIPSADRLCVHQYDDEGQTHYKIEDRLAARELIRVWQVQVSDRTLAIDYEILAGLFDDAAARRIIEERLLVDVFADRFRGVIDRIRWLNTKTQQTHESQSYLT